MKRYTSIKQKGVIAALFLIAFTTGCRDRIVGTEVICPEVQSTVPSNGASNVETDAIISVTFDGKMDPATIIRSSFSFKSDASAELTGTMTFNNNTNTMVFTPDAPMAPNTTYTGIVKKTVTDPAGTAMLEDYKWMFTTAEAPPAPRVIATDPDNEALDVVLNKVVFATFNEGMTASTINQNTFTLFDGNTQINGTVSYENEVASFEPNVDLEYGIIYSATITTGAKNLAGVAVEEDYVWTFKTVHEVVVAPIAPRVISTNPNDAEENVALDKIVTVMFSQAMDASTVNGNTFTLYDGTTKINGTVSYNNEAASFEPNSDLDAETTYTATITTGAKNGSGIALEANKVWTFTTEDEEVIVDPTAPRVISTDPNNQQENVALDKIVTVMFSEAMDASTLNNNTFTLYDGTTKINGTVSSNNAAASFEPNSDLDPETTYTATITTGAKNVAGTALESNKVWTFTTEDEEVVTPTAPRVTSTDPNDGAEDVGLGKIVTAMFNEAMNASTVNDNTFTLYDGATQINGTVSYSNERASFEPDADLEPETTYTATITTGAENEDGIALEANKVWTFTTQDEEVVTPTAPMVTSTNPEDEDENVALNIVVTATFDVAMDPSTLNDNTFTLYDGTTQIDGSVTYNNNNRRASFEPDADLDPETTYTATITTGAENADGVSLEEDYEWTFTTEEEEVIMPNLLGAASTYGIMATAAITSTGNTVINGDVSLEPGTSMTGFPPAVVNGNININNTQSALARASLLVAYNYFKALPPGVTIAAGADLGALYPNGIAPGTYTSGSTMNVSTPLVLDAGGDENAMWVFQIGSSLTTGASVTLTGGANPNNVFWVMTSDATIGVGTTFHGTLVSGRDVTANTGAVINGRILAGAITAGTIALDNNTVNVPE